MSTPSCRRQLPAAARSMLMLAVLLALLLPLAPAAIKAAPAGQAEDPFSHTGDTADRSLARATLTHPAQDNVIYFVLPDRFKNGSTSNDTGNDAGGSSDADVLRHGYDRERKGYYHGGDLQGLRNRLPYLKQMGITAIWMAPIFRNRPVQCGDTVSVDSCSAAYHGYWITDFTDVDPHFGTKQQLRAFVDDAHTRGIKVYFDIVVNHTADVITYAEPSEGYISKAEEPYRDAAGQPFDDREYAGTENFPPLDPQTSFPYTPVLDAAGKTAKQPAWLNDPTLYHNRGNSTFAGESSEYGDFFGLDDLFTEHPDVVDGMIDIYKSWISDYGIDGYRIDTVKHVNMELWQAFGPAILNHAESENKRDFFMFGEVFDGDPRYTSEFTTRGKLPAVLDFGFQGTARYFASQSGKTSALQAFFANDDFYTDADSNAYRLPLFLGNHDIGRIGTFLREDNPGATDAELVARDKLAHALMYFSRGIPVVYYGDEQGFAGDGGDQDAREDMFASRVAVYNDNDLIGTNATTAQDNFNRSHPLYEALDSYAEVRSQHEALRRGAQIHRYGNEQEGGGIYAFSRIEPRAGRRYEYVVVFNNAETEQSATFATQLPNARFVPVWPRWRQPRTTNAAGAITVNMPALSFAIYRSTRELPTSDEAPGIRLAAPAQGANVNGRVAVTAELDASRLAEVTFAVKAGAADWTVIGTDSNAPYGVWYDTDALPAGTALTFKAIANDPLGDTGANVGDLNSDSVAATVVPVVPKPRGQVVFKVMVPANTPADKTVFIAGELSNLEPDLPVWDPGGVALTQLDPTHWTITISGEEGTRVNYKYALGSWDYVEKQAGSCGETANRVLTVAFDASETQVVDDTVANWRNVPPCGN